MPKTATACTKKTQQMETVREVDVFMIYSSFVLIGFCALCDLPPHSTWRILTVYSYSHKLDWYS